MKICKHGCGKDGNFQNKDGSWCCSSHSSKCDALKKKFIPINRYKIKCDKCGKELAKQNFNKHFSSCLVNSCLECGKLVNKSKKFCSQKCSGIYNNKHNENLIKCKRGPERTTKTTCKVCKKYTINTLFCSDTCRNEYNDNYTESCLNGESTTRRVPHTIKKFLLKKRGNKCEICGRTEWEGEPIPLVMDHINGNPYEDTFENLRLICGNCDMLLPTYKGKNSGKGRYERSKRYKDGKSY